MKLRILPSAKQDLDRGQEFYARQGGDSLGDYFLDSLFSDIDSLQLYAGAHAKIFAYHRMLARRFPLPSITRWMERTARPTRKGDAPLLAAQPARSAER